MARWTTYGVPVMKRFALIAALALGGCASSGYYDSYDRYGRADGYYDPYPQYQPARHTGRGGDSAATAERVCSIDPLTAAREEWTTEIREGGYRTGSSRTESRLTTTERPWGPQTETVELVRAFETDLDAAYRFATASCQSYAICMEERGYDEYACQGAADQWRQARTEFNAMSGRLAEIRLEIAERCRDCYSDWRRHDGYRDHYRYRDRGHYAHRRHRDRDCDGILGEVFTTGECEYRRNEYYRGDERRHHRRYRY